MPDPREGTTTAGWCAGWHRLPHHTDHRVPTSAGIPLCQPCALAWIRDDRPQEAHR
jgi:hypothetical protein